MRSDAGLCGTRSETWPPFPPIVQTTHSPRTIRVVRRITADSVSPEIRHAALAVRRMVAGGQASIHFVKYVLRPGRCPALRKAEPQNISHRYLVRLGGVMRQ
jgi:hypothetical protein